MLVSSFETIAKAIALNSINGYQQYISPQKGFSCPHRLLHNSNSCSDYVKNTLTNQNLLSAIELSLERFRDCAAASKTLAAHQTSSGFRCIVIPCCIPL